MPEFRHDPISDTWVIIAEERGHRPQDFGSDQSLDQEHPGREYCPFEIGNEEMTPPELLSIAQTPDRKWDVRVVPNKYPALAIEGDPKRKGLGMFDQMNGIGAHEVVVETPKHNQGFHELSTDQAERVLISYQRRIKDLRKDRRFRYVMAFKNKGQAAGATMSHPHSQIVALSLTPSRIKTQLARARDHFEEKERCLFCDFIRQEQRHEDRVVHDGRDFLVVCPFASRFPFETWILPHNHNHHFTDVSETARRKLASLLRDMLGKLNLALEDPPYNFVINTAPNANDLNPKPGRWATLKQDFHWHLQILPRISSTAGFEYGTGFHINPTPPEEAARYLRECAN